MTTPPPDKVREALEEMPSPKIQTSLAPNWYVKHYETLRQALQSAAVMGEALLILHDALKLFPKAEFFTQAHSVHKRAEELFAKLKQAGG